MTEPIDIFGGRARPGSGGPSPDRLAAFELNDLGNAMRLILLAGGEVDAETGEVDPTRSILLYLLGVGWIGFNGRHWDAKFGDELARKLAHQVARKLRALTPLMVTAATAHLRRGDESVDEKTLSAAASAIASKVRRFVDDAGGAGKTSAMLQQAQSYVTVEIDAFDADPLALNCRNGTLRMRHDPKAGFVARLDPHDPADRIRRMAAVEYSPGAACPTFDRVVCESLPDAAERDYFGRVLGYASTGCIHEQAFFLAQGRGRDGKSTLLDACRDALGAYAEVGNVETFLEGLRNAAGPDPELVKLAGDVRLVVLSEPPRGSKLNEGRLKAWTSGSPISARDLNAKPISFRPGGKLIWECNAFPVARGDDDGIWRRIKPVMFRVQVPEAKVDKTIPTRIRAVELPGVLNWLVARVGDWLARGLDPPASLRTVVDDYRRASSPFGDWLASRCAIGEAADGQRTLTGELYADFKQWFEDQGFEKPMSVRAFGDALRDRQVFVMGKDRSGKKYRGPIRLKTPDELDDMAAGEARAELEAATRAGAGGLTLEADDGQ